MIIQDCVAKLDHLIAILSKSSADRLGQPSLPTNFPPNALNSIVNLITYADEIREDFRFAFLGYGALGVSDIKNEFEKPGQRGGFFGAYEYEGELRLTEAEQIALEDSLEGELETPELIDDLRNIVPLFEFQGDYIVADLGPRHNGALISIVDGYNGSLLAPGLIAHIEDLKCGLQEHSYWIVDEELVFPSAWYQRQGVRSGQLKMDDYGEIVT
jgi:hypothetical protein